MGRLVLLGDIPYIKPPPLLMREFLRANRNSRISLALYNRPKYSITTFFLLLCPALKIPFIFIAGFFIYLDK